MANSKRRNSDGDKLNRRAGRPLKAMSADAGAQARLLVASGISQSQVAALLKISRKTLQRRFGQELENGAMILRAQNLLRLSAAAQRGNVSAMKQLDVRFRAAAEPRNIGAGRNV